MRLYFAMRYCPDDERTEIAVIDADYYDSTGFWNDDPLASIELIFDGDSDFDAFFGCSDCENTMSFGKDQDENEARRIMVARGCIEKKPSEIRFDE